MQLNDFAGYAKMVDFLAEAERAYYNGSPIIEDRAYDVAYQRLQKFEQENPEDILSYSPTQRVGEEIVGARATHTRAIPMLSLENMYDEAAVEKFVEKVSKVVESPEWSVQPKIDGMAVELVYEEGILMTASTRGDGKTGEDVLANARTIGSIPLRLVGERHGITTVRGEVYMKTSVFKRLQAADPTMKNPRNSAVGALKSKDPKETAAKCLDFLAYWLEPTEAEQDVMTLTELQGMGFQVPWCISTDNTGLMRCIRECDAHRIGLDYWTDGTVVKLSQMDLRRRLGNGTKCPNWACAAKFGKRQASTRVKGITIQVGKTGVLAPVAELEDVELSGSTIKRATLHNADEIGRLGVRVGSTVTIEKAGEIIPAVVAVEEVGQGLTFQFPDHCPSCGGRVWRSENEAAYVCTDWQMCPAQVKGRLEHWGSKGAMDIDGLGEVMVTRLYDDDLVVTPADLYFLSMQSFAQAGTTTPHMAQKLLDAIEASKSRGLEKVLYALCIPHVGKGTAERLVRHFYSMNLLENATEEQLLQVEDIGETTATAIVDWFSEPYNKRIISSLREAGVKLETDKPKEAVSNSLEGKTVVVTGTFNFGSRDAVHDLIRQHGGKVAGSVSKKTGLVVYGEDSGSKLDKAIALKVPYMSEAEFMKSIGV